MAEGITQAEALDIASEFFKSFATRTTNEQLSIAKASTGYYAINRGRNGGFVIVAADNRLGSQVLGYSDQGAIDTLSMPSSMKWLFRQYDNLSTSSSPSFTTRATTSRTAIAPLLTCYWGQGAPYYNNCPTYKGDTCCTGCVATAIAQIMYYHKWPKQGTSSISYTCQINGEETRTLSKDFSQTTYDWEAMADYYPSGSSERAKNAVAQLMADAGYGSQMAYGIDASSAQSPRAANALVNYFNYDKAIRYVSRDYYTHEEWNDMLYGELANSRPFYYSGCDNGMTIGHAFVIDGYANGYYHVNWGWDGLSNGYFLIADLTPSDQGAVGSGSGFSYFADAIIGIQPPVAGSAESIELYNYYPLTLNSPTSSFKKTATPWFQCYVYSESLSAHNLTPGLKVIDGSGNVSYVKGDHSKTLTIYDDTDNNNVLTTFKVDMKQFPTTEGSYDVFLACYENDLNTWIEPRVSVVDNIVDHLRAKVESSTITFSTPPATKKAILKATNTSLSSRVIADTLFYCTALCTANSSDYYGDLTVGFATSQSSSDFKVYGSCSTPIDIGEGESQQVKFTAKAPNLPGTYYMKILDSSSNPISDPIKVTVESMPMGNVAFEALGISMPSTTDVDIHNINISFDVKCTSGFYNNVFYATFFETGAQYYTTYTTSDVAILAKGDSATITFATDAYNLLEGKTYQVYIYGNDKYFTPYAKSSLSFTTAAKSAIESPTTDGFTHAISVYTIGGTLVSSQSGAAPDLSPLPKGIYIVKEGGKSYKVAK